MSFHSEKRLNPDYAEPFGKWKVTTEGDCEGRSTNQLGIFEGHLDEIALGLADKAMYSLTFSRVIPQVKKGKDIKATSVNVTLDIDSGTWNMPPEKRTTVLAEILQDRPVRVETGTYHASVRILAGRTREEGEALKAAVTRAKALEKLTPEDRRALGLE